jgi:hypothetical protein
VIDPLDELISDILEDSPKPQPSKAEASVVDTQSEEPHEEEDTDLTWKRVPARKRNPTCGTCRAKLKGGTWHWYYKDDDGDISWWCYKCMASIDCLPTEEEMKRAEKSTKV